MLRRLTCLVVFFVSLLASPIFTVSAYAWDAIILKVVDGDTLLVSPKSAKSPHDIAISVRLYGIDAPELKQEGGQNSKAALEQIAYTGGQVEIIPIESDRYDRPVVLVVADGTVLNREQIRNGHAWVYEKYCRASLCNDLIQFEKKARETKCGLWSAKKAVAPWEWRKLVK